MLKVISNLYIIINFSIIKINNYITKINNLINNKINKLLKVKIL